MRVSLVKLADGQVWFAPHDHSPWLQLPVDTSIGDSELAVGQVGELYDDESAWLFEVDLGQRVELCALTQRRGPGEMTFLVRPGEEVLDLTDHGVDLRLKGKAQHLGLWRLVPRRSGDPAGHFNTPDLGKWAAEVDREKEAKKVAKIQQLAVQQRNLQRESSAEYFVNPYTFVPFPSMAPARKAPTGHHRLDNGHFSGRLNALLVARSPLLVRNIGTETGKNDQGVSMAPRKAGVLFIPGSSIHGTIRSLHETLTGSCLRVFDPEFIPVYRDVTSVNLRKNWGLGVVREVSSSDDYGRPTRIRSCVNTKWVSLATLARVLPAGVRVTTGQRFRLPGGFRNVNGREVYDDSQLAEYDDAGGNWIVLVTNPSTRMGKHYGVIALDPGGDGMPVELFEIDHG